MLSSGAGVLGVKKVEAKERDKQYAYWLSSIPGIGNRTIGKLLAVCGGTAKRVYEAKEARWEQVLRSRQLENMKRITENWRLKEEYEKLADGGITFCSVEDAEYPERLRNIPDAPYGVFVKGRLPGEDIMSVAIIGARDCSEYGSFVAAGLGRYLAEQGIQIISGMARGIDGISQEAALAAGGASFGVLGCGVDICYPAQNKRLYESLTRDGGILSAYVPGTKPSAGHFPPRNRIVSGLADVIIVIEARKKSGTLITVDMALEQGKDVYVVPGRITDRLSDGCNSLICQGAGVLLSPEDFLEEITTVWKQKRRFEQIGKKEEGNREAEFVPGLPPQLRAVYEALDFYPLAVEQIMAKLPDSYNHISINTALLQLCMQGRAQQLSPGFFRRKGEQNSILFSTNQL